MKKTTVQKIALKTALFPALIVSLSLVGCSKEKAAANGVTLSSTELQSERIDMEAASVDQCANGGTFLQTYIDLNGNSVLDEGETVLATSVVCAGASGANGTNGMNGTNGSNGADGKDGSNGVDGTNGSNGAAGAAGAAGANGKDGTNGIDGINGQDAVSPYAIVFAITSGAKSCVNGGSTITFALDVNANGQLDEEDKQTQSTEICNGTNGVDGKDGVVSAVADFTCRAVVKSSSSWKEGYIVDLYITYNGPARTGWKVDFTLPDNQSIVNIWNASPSALKGKISASSYSYNEKLEKGSQLTFGFQVLRSKDLMIAASALSLNGVACKY